MSKGLLLVVSLVITLLMPGSAAAHVLIKDEVKGTGAILHVNPDDDPVAGERALLFFDIRDNSITPKSSQAVLTITDEQGAIAVVPSELVGSSVSANYIFPRQGLYEVRLAITRGGKPVRVFVQSQRVSRGILGSVTTPSAPVWSQVGVLFSILTAIFAAIIAFNRRKAISEYSKF